MFFKVSFQRTFVDQKVSIFVIDENFFMFEVVDGLVVDGLVVVQGVGRRLLPKQTIGSPGRRVMLSP